MTDPSTGNLLRHAASPYLLQHADNPVHWRPWGPEALAEARATGRPILLSVGYAACHWCHVMAHESFEDPAVAAVMNRLYVNIKVDREERPDIDQIYMAALHALGQPGGWPLTMFLTPDGAPVWGGTYFPKEPRWGRPGFVQVLEEVARVFRTEPGRVETNRRALTDAIRARARTGVTLDRDLLDRAAATLAGLADPDHGGTRGAPKFPQAGLLELLWRAGTRTGEPRFRDHVLLTLRRMADGGIWDHVGGGFARYAVDEAWLVPHFEKMLYDNALLLDLCGLAWSATGEVLFRERIEQLVDWLGREMRTAGGGFASSLDADSEGHEGRFYVWTRAEVDQVLGPDDGAFFAEAYDIRPDGNWEGVSIPNRSHAPARRSDADETRLAGCRARLFACRAGRVRPGLDDKILADWNGYAIAALARAARRLDRSDWLDLALGAYRFVATAMACGDRLGHSRRDDALVFPGLATDHAALVAAALALHEATGDPERLADARRWAEALDRHHWDAEAGGWFLTADDAEALIVRPKSALDEATPNHNGLMVENLVRLWIVTGEERWRDRADRALAAFSGDVVANVFGTAALLNALDSRLEPLQLVVVAPPGTDAGPLLAVAARAVDRRLVLLRVETTDRLGPRHPAHGRRPVDGRPTAWLCRAETCSLPVTEPADLAARLGVAVG